jgi:hypothetical protein
MSMPSAFTSREETSKEGEPWQENKEIQEEII